VAHDRFVALFAAMNYRLKGLDPLLVAVRRLCDRSEFRGRPPAFRLVIAGNPDSRRRLETRLLHHERMPGRDEEYGNQVWHGYTYVWNDEQTDSLLLDAQGLDREYTIRDPKAPGGRRTQTWHFPSRAECTLCHTMSARYALGVNTLQMNRERQAEITQEILEVVSGAEGLT
jgi:hypothetical protein